MENRKNRRNTKNPNKNDAGVIENKKKPFNKKRYREQKYSNKYKVNKWEERRKKTILKGFLKDLKNDEKATISNFSKTKDSIDKSDDLSNKVKRKAKPTLVSIRENILEKQRQRKEEILKIRKEKEEALNLYKKKKMNSFKQLSKKTKKGQPVMKARMELLLEKIQQSV